MQDQVMFLTFNCLLAETFYWNRYKWYKRFSLSKPKKFDQWWQHAYIEMLFPDDFVIKLVLFTSEMQCKFDFRFFDFSIFFYLVAVTSSMNSSQYCSGNNNNLEYFLFQVKSSLTLQFNLSNWFNVVIFST